MGDDENPVLEALDKVEETFKGAYERGERWGEETGITPGWANAAHDVDPELAKSAADDWDKGDHAKAVGKFLYSTGESISEGVSGFFSGITGEVEAKAPDLGSIPTEPEQIGPVTHVEHETMP
jgi:hypothetical protein